jgi:hypothetical protein|tara:strand:+ start:389 stop:898 length:510 start_codon:yes stop_codon:yes gene_type:complete
MAGVYAPSLKFNANTWVSVKAADLTSYEDIQSTQGTIVYRAESLYLQTNSIDQINEPIDVQIYDSNGKLTKNKRVNVADTYQFQPAINIDLKQNPIIFNGRTRIVLNLLPLQSVKLYFQTVQLEPSDFLDGGNNFFSEDFLDTYGFFEGYNEKIQEKIMIIEKSIKLNS